MTISQQYNSSHATAFPGSDAPSNSPATVVKLSQAGALNVRKNLFIGCWNVRTLLQVGSQELTLRALYDYRIDIACLSEVRLPDSGSRRIKIPDKDASYWLYHSGPVDNTGQHGVALALSQVANNALISWEAISPRIMLARFKGHPLNISVISVYAPTLPSDDTIKDDFYGRLQAVVDLVPRRDILVIAGDWNSRTGPADDATHHILGNFGLGQRCANGDRLINFADLNRMCITNTRFQHPKKHLLTWYSNDGRTSHQLDYILIRSRWASSVEDCRAYRGAEAGNRGGSDHMLVRAKFKLHLTTRRKTCRSKRLNVANLDDINHRRALTAELTTKLANERTAPENPQPESVDIQWSRLKTTTQQSALAELGTVAQCHKDWISSNTMRLSALAKTSRLANSPDYRILRREATRSARSDRNRYWSQMAENMESASHAGDFGTLFRLIRTASGKHQGPQPVLKDADGRPIPELDRKITRWVQHFSELLNHEDAQPATPTSSASSAPYDFNCLAPTEEEISGIIARLKNKKAPGEDGLPAEIYKACTTALLDALQKLFCSIWESEIFPSDWSTSILLPFPKKGDKTVCENYRGISLLDTAAKIFTSLLLNRFATQRHLRTRPNQGGFRPGMGCVDQIFTLRRTLEHRYKFQQPTVACFIDFRAAFDSINRDGLWQIMLNDGAPPKLVRLIKSYYSATKARVRVYGEESCEFNISTGVRQGCPLSPVLFNYAVDWVMEQALRGYTGVQLNETTWITDLDYADDIVLLGDSFQSIRMALTRVSQYATMIGLEINTSKTKLFAACVTNPGPPIQLGDSTIESVESFKYLGSVILPNGQAKNEVQSRINNARRTFLQLKNTLWRRTEINLRTKIQVYQAAIRPVLLYGCETWPLRKEDARQLEVFDHWCLRILLKTNWRDRLSNDTVRQRCFGITQLTVHLQQRRLQWFGHVLRKTRNDITKRVLSPGPCPGWRCRLGGQLKTWLNNIKADVDLLGLQAVYGVRRWKQDWLSICEDLAADRGAWRAVIRDIHGAGSSFHRRQLQ